MCAYICVRAIPVQSTECPMSGDATMQISLEGTRFGHANTHVCARARKHMRVRFRADLRAQ